MPDPSKPQREAELNAHVHAMMTSPPGLEVMKWLRRVTIETVAGPEVSNDTLRHLEGQRFIVALLETRKLMHTTKTENDLGRSPQPDPERAAERTRERLARARGPINRSAGS